MKSTTLKCNSNLPNDIIFHIYQHQLVPKKKKTANIHGNTKLAIMAILPILSVCEKLDAEGVIYMKKIHNKRFIKNAKFIFQIQNNFWMKKKPLDDVGSGGSKYLQDAHPHPPYNFGFQFHLVFGKNGQRIRFAAPPLELASPFEIPGSATDRELLMMLSYYWFVIGSLIMSPGYL